MPAAARKGDMCTGHGDFPPRASISGNETVLINGKAALCVGDGWDTHCNPLPVCHNGVQSVGSGTVFVGGKALARVGDAVSCGSSIASGSSDVFAQ
ncbi:MAG: PAAR domain-containing protein [Enterovibrio sp.]